MPKGVLSEKEQVSTLETELILCNKAVSEERRAMKKRHTIHPLPYASPAHSYLFTMPLQGRKTMKKVLIKGGLIALMTALALLAGCLSYSVESVEISIDGNATSIDAGKTIQFNFLVTATGKDTSQAQRVNWSVSSTNDGTGPVTAGTSISPSGTLAVSPDEIYPILYVRATHATVRSKYDFKQIQVKGPKVGSVVLSVSGDGSAVAGGTAKLSGFVAGQAPNQGLTYSVGSASNGTGAVVAGTSIAADGTLTVSANETASSLYVKAVSNSDATKFDIKEIKIVTVTSVTVSAEGGTARVLRGGRLNFSAAVAGNNNPGQNVTWKVSSNAAGTGTVTDGTAISSNGTLSVAAAEASATLYVTATSTINTAKSGSITVTIPTVTSVTVAPANPQIKRGEGATFTARVQGTGNPGQEVTWKLDGIGGSTTVTTITSNGMVIVNTAETLSQLLITATSVDDPAKFGTTMVTIPAVPAAVVPIDPNAPYIITGSGAAFTATRGGATVGTANQPIQTVIEAVRANAAGAACRIQFGDGATPLNIGPAQVVLNNTGGNWGAITLSGKISGSAIAGTAGVIQISGNVSVTTTAEITNIAGSAALGGNALSTNSSGSLTVAGGKISTAGRTANAIYSNGSSAITMTDGTVEVTGSGNGILNTGSGTLTMTGGTVIYSGNGGDAVYHNSEGAMTMSGGTIDGGRTGGAAVRGGYGKITVSGTAMITLANGSADAATILVGTLDGAAVRLEITGGTVRNTSGTATANAVRNNSPNEIIINGGTVSAPGGNAVNNVGYIRGGVTKPGKATIGPNAKIEGNKVNVP
jgi:hypothetical protein